MIFVRGIMGGIKLNPAIRIWGGLFLFAAATVAGLVWHFLDSRDEIEACESGGGVWVGGAAPARLGRIRSLDGFCAAITQRKDQW